jgi:hypothetical protein
MDEVAKSVGVANKPAMREALKAGELQVMSALAAAGVKGGHLRGVGKKGAHLGVIAEVTGPDAAPLGVLKASGPWHFIEHDNRPHQIPRATSKGRRRYAVIAGQPYSVAHHPGTKGKHPWKLGTEKAKPEIARVYARELVATIRKVF